MQALPALAKPPYQVVGYCNQNTEAPPSSATDTGQGAAINWATDVPWADLTVVADAFMIPKTNDTFTAAGQGAVLVNAAHAQNVRCIASIGGSGQDSAFATLCNSAGNRTAFASAVTAMMASDNYDGVDIDWETTGAASQANATLMMEALYTAIKALPNCSVDGKPHTLSFTTNPSYSAIFNMTTLATYSDWCLFMGYDWYDTPTTYANGPLNGVSPSIVSSITGMTNGSQWSYPMSKMILGCPLYTNDYNAGNEIDVVSILNLGTAGAYDTSYAEQAYTAPDGNTVYVDTAQSYCDKINWAVGKGAMGIGMWDMGQGLPTTANSEMVSIWNTIGGNGACLTVVGPTNTPTATFTNTIVHTATPSATFTNTASKTATSTFTDTVAMTATFTNTASKTFTMTFTNTASKTATLTSTNTAANTMTPSSTFTNTVVNTNTHTSTATNTFTQTVTLTPSNTWSPSMTNTGTQSPTNSPTITNTFTNTMTASFSPTSTLTVTNTASNTITSTPTFTPTATMTDTGTLGPTSTATNTFTNTFSGTPNMTNTFTATITNTPTKTLTNTSTSTLTFTPTATLTYTNTFVFTTTATYTPTTTFTNTFTGTDTLTATYTPTMTKTSTPINTATSTYSFTPTPVLAVCPGVPVWSGSQVAYGAGQEVGYNGELYICIQAHTSLAGLTPPTQSSLWKDMGACGSTPTVTGGHGNPVVYPNPCTGSMTTIELPVPDATNVKVQIFTLAFREVQTIKVEQMSGDSLLVPLVDKSGRQLADGLYYFVIQINGTRWVNKVLILR